LLNQLFNVFLVNKEKVLAALEPQLFSSLCQLPKTLQRVSLLAEQNSEHLLLSQHSADLQFK